MGKYHIRNRIKVYIGVNRDHMGLYRISTGLCRVLFVLHGDYIGNYMGSYRIYKGLSRVL